MLDTDLSDRFYGMSVKSVFMGRKIRERLSRDRLRNNSSC